MPAPDSIFFRRKSLRSFLDKPIEQDKLDRILEATRWSPSSNNNQPWKFIFVRDREQHAKFIKCLSKWNDWAVRAPLLVAVISRPKDDSIRTDDPVQYYQFGCGLAVMSFLLATVDEGLLAHPMGGYDAFALKTALDIPDEYHVQCIITVGYQGSLDQLDERTRKKDEAPRTRKAPEEIFAYDRFTFDRTK